MYKLIVIASLLSAEHTSIGGCADKTTLFNTFVEQSIDC
jgi:hypothetical protein